MKVIKAIGHYVFIKSTPFTLPAFILCWLAGIWLGHGEVLWAAGAAVASLIANAFGEVKG